MGENIKLDVNISQRDIERMAKQVIKEIINDKIEEAMKNVDIEKIIEDKMKDIDTKISKQIKDISNRYIPDLYREVKKEIGKQTREVVLEEIEKKPLSGNVYLKINKADVETDYDDDLY